MAEYVQSNINVSISEDCFEEAYYIHFGYFKKDNNGYVTSVEFDKDKRYRIDSSRISNSFPNLYSNSFYSKADLNLGIMDSFLGSKVINEETTVISIIYPNEFFLEDTESQSKKYCFAFITGDSVEDIPEINIPYNYRYSVNNMYNQKETVSAVSKVIGAYDNTKWLYLIDCQWISNIWCSYIIHFYIQQSKYNDSIQDISIKLHTVKTDSHQNDISDFANAIESQKILSHFILNNSLNTTYNKMNGLISMSPLQHRLLFFGTPYGYKTTNFEVINENNWEELSTGVNSYYYKLKEDIQLKKTTPEEEDGNKYLFGNNQINKITYDSGSYTYDSIKDDNDAYNKYQQNQLSSVIYSLFLNRYQNPKYGIILTEKGFVFEGGDKPKLTVNLIQANLTNGSSLGITLENDSLLVSKECETISLNTNNNNNELRFDIKNPLYKLSNNGTTLFLNSLNETYIDLSLSDKQRDLQDEFNTLVTNKFPEIMNGFECILNISDKNPMDIKDVLPEQLLEISFLYCFKASSYQINYSNNGGIKTEIDENGKIKYTIYIDYYRKIDINDEEIQTYISLIFGNQSYETELKLNNKYNLATEIKF